MSPDDIKQILVDHKDDFAQRYHVSKIGIFGSYARNEQRADSDIDILVDFDQRIGMFTFVRLEQYIESLTGIKVDLVTSKALKAAIKQSVLDEIVYL